jgi:hypothetical protein
LDETPNPYDPQAGSPPAKTPGRRLPRAALAGGIAIGLALGGAGLAYAASSSSPTNTPAASGTSSTTNPPSKDKPGHPFRGRGFAFGGLGFGLGLNQIVHGSVTVRSGNSYKTIDVQVGQVTSVSSSSITVKSTDGYTQTYAVIPTTIVDSQAGGISSVATNDQVELMATPQKGTDTAANIVDTSKIQNSRGAFGFPTAPKPVSPGSGSSSSTGWFGYGPGPSGGQAQ